MKQTKYPVEKIIQILSEAELPGSSIAEVCRKYSIARSTFDKWRQKFKGMSSSEAKRLKALEDENLRLKRILAEKELEIQVLRDIVKKKLLTINERRVIAKHMIQSGINVRKTAEILEIPLSTLYYSSCKAEKDMALTEMIKDIAFKYTFYGYRRIHMVIKRAGHHVNHKKVYRIYKTLNLQRQKPRKNKRLISVHMPLTQPRFCNHVWAIDFLFDSLTDRRLIKIMTIEDLMSRFCVGIEVGFSITANMVIEVIERCINVYGIPRVIRTDQGSEFRSIIFEKFIQRYGIRHEFIEKASPWQNGALESFNGKLREECLSRNLFETLMQARKVIDEYRKFYNTERPHSGICNKMPSEVFSNSS